MNVLPSSSRWTSNVLFSSTHDCFGAVYRVTVLPQHITMQRLSRSTFSPLTEHRAAHPKPVKNKIWLNIRYLKQTRMRGTLCIPWKTQNVFKLLLKVPLEKSNGHDGVGTPATTVLNVWTWQEVPGRRIRKKPRKPELFRDVSDRTGWSETYVWCPGEDSNLHARKGTSTWS